MAWSLLIHNIFLYRRYWIIRHKQQYCTWGGWIVPCSLHTTQLCLTLAVGCGGNVLVPITLLLFKSPCPVLLQGFKGMVTRSALASTSVLMAPGIERPTAKVLLGRQEHEMLSFLILTVFGWKVNSRDKTPYQVIRSDQGTRSGPVAPSSEHFPLLHLMIPNSESGLVLWGWK